MKNDFTIERDRLGGVEAFLRVAERRSFRAAAVDLGVSPSAVSQLVKALEARIGVPLLARTSRSVGLTEAGEMFVERAQPGYAAIAAAYRAAQDMGREPMGTLRLTAPRAIYLTLLEPILTGFHEAFPKVFLEIHADDGFTDIVAGGYDAGLRLGEHLQDGMVATRLSAPFPFVVVGAPSYLARFGRPAHPDDLDAHRCIRVRMARGHLPPWLFKDGDRTIERHPPAALVLNDHTYNSSAAAAGAGLAYAGRPLVEDHIAAGRLVPLLEDYAHESPGSYLYYPNRKHMTPKLRAFIDYLRPRVPAKWAI